MILEHWRGVVIYILQVSWRTAREFPLHDAGHPYQRRDIANLGMVIALISRGKKPPRWTKDVIGQPIESFTAPRLRLSAVRQRCDFPYTAWCGLVANKSSGVDRYRLKNVAEAQYCSRPLNVPRASKVEYRGESSVEGRNSVTVTGAGLQRCLHSRSVLYGRGRLDVVNMFEGFFF